MSKALDKFYTNPTLVALCYNQIPDLADYDLLVEPSAGSGAFLQHPLPASIAVKAYDILPEGANIISVDFLTLKPTEIRGTAKRVLTIGNPPFGRNCSSALKFINQAAGYSDTIAFILPKSFKKVSTQNKVSLAFELVSTIDLPANGFLLDGTVYDVPCVFQVWRRGLVPRDKLVTRTTTSLFTFTTANKAQLSVRRVGVYAGMAYPTTDKSPQSHYFITLPPDSEVTTASFIEKCNSIKWEHNNTSGPRSISKGELIEHMETLLVSTK